LNLPYSRIYQRIARGASPQEALFGKEA
jgi:hypothetical protein